MQNFNLKKAYLTNVDGVLYIKLTGSASDRIDDVNISLNNSNELTLQYNNLHWRYNETKRGYDYFDSRNLEFYSFLDADEVLPEFLTEFTYTETKKRWFKPNEIIEHKQLLPMNGEVRINKIPVRTALFVKVPFYIEYICEPLEGNLYQKK